MRALSEFISSVERLFSNVLFSCGNCIVTYYDKTKCYLNIRSGEHGGISNLAGKRVECKLSVVLDRLVLHNYDSDVNDFTILCRDNNGLKLLVK